MSSSQKEEFAIIDICHVNNVHNKSKLSLSIAPGKKDHIYNRNLEHDLNIIKREGIHVVICLLEWSELYNIKMQEYPIRAQELGLFFYHFPIKDHHTPNIDDVIGLIPIIISHLEKGHNVLVHCKGGKGRAGTIISCCLCYFGFSPEDSISTIRSLRNGAIKRDIQVQFVKTYHNTLNLHR